MRISPPRTKFVTWVFALIAAYVLIVAAAMAAGLGGSRVIHLLGILNDVPVEIATLALFAIVAEGTAPGPLRTAWRFFAAGLAFDLIANIMVLAPLLRNDDPYYSAALTGFYFGFYLSSVVGAGYLLRSAKIRLPWQQLVLDALIFIIGFGAFYWFLAVRPVVASGDVSPMPLLTQAYTAFNCLIVLLLDLAVLGSADSATRRSSVLLLTGFSLSFFGDLMWALSEMQHRYVPGMAQDIIYLLSFIPLAAAAKGQMRGADASASWESKTSAVIARYLPYVPAIGAFFSLVYLTYGTVTGPVMTLTIIAVCLTALLIVREGALLRVQAAQRARQAAALVEQRYATLTAYGSDAFLVVSRTGVIQLASAASERLFSHAPNTLHGKNILTLWPPALHGSLQAFLAATGTRSRGAEGPLEMYLDGPSKPRVFEMVGLNLIEDPAVQGLALTFRDISERKRMEARLRKLAFQDRLTGLANRNFFCDQMDEANRRCSDGAGFAIALLDLDDFKHINEFSGHAAGDQLLKAVAERLRRVTPASYTLARMGGDEFGILLADASSADESAQFAAKLLAVLEEPVAVGTNTVRVRASVGIANTTGGGKNDDLLVRAVMALHHAKGAGKNQIVTFVPEMMESLHARIRLGADIQRAFANDEFFLDYQPIVDLGTRCLLGVEALARWQHPERGLIAPNQFIPVMEDSGQIIDLGRWALLRACQELCAWRDQVAGGHELRVAVNVSGKHLQSGTLEADIAAALRSTGLQPSNLVIELTESTLMSETESNLARLRDIKRLGVRIAIDDFGTGYSSLAYLHRFPIDILKIDRSFVSGLSQSDNGRELARAVISLGESLGIDTVAEGIEEEQQILSLLDLGCVAGQGFLFQKPASFERLLASEFVARRNDHWKARALQESFSATGRFTALKKAAGDASAKPAKNRPFAKT